MSQPIPEETIQQIQSQVNIVDIVSQYVSIKKRGKNYFGHCPFHEERTPSFSVSEEKQIYHCFSCGRGGGVFSFISEIEGMSFVESVAKVAELAQLPFEFSVEETVTPESQTKKQLLKAHQEASKFYQHVLNQTRGGEAALQYLEGRGYTKETIETFEMGYSLKDRTYVANLMKQLSLSEEEMEATGLFVRRQDGFMDRFFERVMIPLRNPNGQVIGFSGRVLPSNVTVDDEPQAKYLNSPETELFNKRNFLFNFDLAKSEIRKKNQVVLFEGYMDVIAAWQAGVKNGVASMGTSLTQEQVAQLQKITQDVVIAYDGDQPGLDATNRAIELLQQYSQLSIEILPLDNGLDPDEFIQQYGAEAFQERLDIKRESVFQFKKRYLSKKYRLDIERERVQFLEEIVTELAKISKPIEREVAIQSIATEFEITPDILSAQVQSQSRMQRSNPVQSRRLDVFEEGISASDTILQLSQKQLLYRLLHSPTAWNFLTRMNDAFEFPEEDFQQLYQLLKGYRQEMDGEVDTSGFMNFLSASDLRNRHLVSAIEWMDFPEDCSEQEIADLLYVLSEKDALKSLYQQKKQALREAQLMNHQQEANQLMLELLNIQKKLKK